MKPACTEYTYDLNGNMISDSNKGIVNVEYNILNLPEKIEFADGKYIQNYYDAAGVKYKKKVDYILHEDYTNYSGGFIYQNGELKEMQHAEGRLVKTGTSFQYEYYLKDHLGNIRTIFNRFGTVVQEDHYYPFGMTYQSYTTGTENPYKYNGKELNQEHNLDWYDYGARFYDAQLGRWHRIDPMAEKYYSYTGYHYVRNNPIS